MRLTVPAPNFYVNYASMGVTEELNRYIKIPGVVTGGVVDEDGLNALDIWACLLSRCTSWNVTFTGSLTDADGSGSLSSSGTATSGLYDGFGTITSYPGYLGYDDHPEVVTATGLFLEAAVSNIAATGSYTPTVGPATTWDIDFFMDFRPNASFGANYNGPLLIGSDLYIPFSAFTIYELTGTASGYTFSTQNQAIGPEFEFTVGTFTISIPNWRFGGTNTLTIPIFGFDTLGTATGSLNITITPATCFKYGIGELNDTPIWNNDGSANLNPLL